jgi:hypothetical protein
VRAAGAEGFGPAFSGVNVEDAGNYKDVRAKDDQTWDNNIKSTETQTYYFINENTRAGEPQYRI